MIHRLLAVLALLLTAHAVHAGCPTVSYTYRKAVVVQPHYAPAAIAVPYSYGYSGYYNAGYDPQSQLVKDQAELIRNQQKFIEQQRLGSHVRPGTNGQGFASFEDFARQACIECHQDGTKAVESNEFIMFEKDGSLSPFSVAERSYMKELIEKGKMPKKPLADDVKNQAVQLLDRLSSRRAQK